MAKGVYLKVQGLAELKKKFGRIPDDVAQEVDAEMHAASLDFVDWAVRDAPKDRGILIQGISAASKGIMHHEVVSSSPISPYIEFGTRRRVSVPSDLSVYAQQFKGTGDGSGDGFFKNILQWVKRKGIRYESASKVKSGKNKGKNKLLTIEQTAYVIYHFLLINGIRPHPFFFKQRGPVMAQLKQNLKPALTRALNK